MGNWGWEGVMSIGLETRRTILFVNWAHALDHFVLLIFPTAVIAVAADLHRGYGELISLSTGAFVAFGLFALPVGWLADRFGRRALLAVYFFGYGASCLLVAASGSLATLAVSLFLLGVFSAIYHPIGPAMIVANAAQLGRALGLNGIWGKVGIPFADLGKNIGPLACTTTHILSKDVEFPGMLQFWMNGLQRTHGLGQGRGYPLGAIWARRLLLGSAGRWPASSAGVPHSMCLAWC